MYPAWMSWAVRLAAGYALLGSALLLLFPGAVGAWLGLAMPPDAALLRYAGMLACSAGVGLALASPDPIRHWRLVLLGLISKFAAPLAFLSAAGSRGTLQPLALAAGLMDVAWFVPLAAVVAQAWRDERAVDDIVRGATVRPLGRLLETTPTQAGESLGAIAGRSPTLLVFLRHAGCTFCRQTLHDLATVQERLTGDGIRIALVHQSSPGAIESLSRHYGLKGADLVEDRGRKLYRFFGLGSGSFRQLYSPLTWLKGLWAGLAKGHGIGRPDGDVRQMPGAFVVFRNQVISSYYHRNPADRPDYPGLCAAALNRIADHAALRS